MSDKLVCGAALLAFYGILRIFCRNSTGQVRSAIASHMNADGCRALADAARERVSDEDEVDCREVACVKRYATRLIVELDNL